MQVSASLGLKAPAPAAGGAAAWPKAAGAAAHQEVDLMGGLDDEPAAAVGTQHAVHCPAVHAVLLSGTQHAVHRTAFQAILTLVYILQSCDRQFRNTSEACVLTSSSLHVGHRCKGIWRCLECFRGCW
jgi:hypothetical protein